MATYIPDIQSPIGDVSSLNQGIIQRFSHIHPVTVVDGVGEFKCDGCQTYALGKTYRCIGCSYDYHYHCATCPPTLRTSMHPLHELELADKKSGFKRVINRLCDFCDELIEGLFYKCKICDFDVHPLCTSESQQPVFINFHGNDLRYGFVSHLAKTLRRYGAVVNVDSDEREGTDLNTLFKRIEQSRIAIVILSGMYTESYWRLAELVKIMERASIGKLVVIPIFYNVDMDDVKYLKGVFGDNFWKLKESYGDEWNKWMDSLLSVLRIQGFMMNITSDEGKFIDHIVMKVMSVLSTNSKNQARESTLVCDPDLSLMSKEEIWAERLNQTATKSVQDAEVFCDNTFLWNKNEESIMPLRSITGVKEDMPQEDKSEMPFLSFFTEEEMVEEKHVRSITGSSSMVGSYDSGSRTSIESIAGKSATTDVNMKNVNNNLNVLVFSCNYNRDVDETYFTKAILNEFLNQDATPLTYNLSDRESPNTEMLHSSTVGIMILSNNYACSSKSMDQLVAIMEHREAAGLVIIPIYFKVTLSDISEMKGCFGEAFMQLGNSVQAVRVQKWKAALTEVASTIGYEWTKGDQHILADEVVRNACLRLFLKKSKNMIRVLAMLVHSQPSEVEFFGIWGMAGIGKTTIAREVFETLAPRYDFCYYMQDFHQMCQMKGLRQLRDDFFSTLFGEEKLVIDACDTKPSFMKSRFQKKKLLIVLDDVSNAIDAEFVVGGFGWFSCGHRIILTSRNRQVLVQCKLNKLYKIQNLSQSESFRFLSLYTTEKGTLLTSELVNYASGMPLALTVLGSYVKKQLVHDEKNYLHTLRQLPPVGLQDAFRKSFDGLLEEEKRIFLDIACFFRGENKDHVIQVLDGCGFYTDLGLCSLIDQSLISLSNNKIEIHNVLQDIGRYVVCKESREPSKRSRLWDGQDIAAVLTKASGTEAIEGIFLDASQLTCELSPIVFKRMYRLRLLKLHCSNSRNQCKLYLPQGLHSLPNELRLLHWEGYSLASLPRKFNPKNLVELNMPYSSMKKLWKGTKNLQKLKKIRLSHSRQLTRIPRLSMASTLEHIDLEGCTSLVKVSSSISYLDKLVYLNLRDCSRLRGLPVMINLKSLEVLNLSGCSDLEEVLDISPSLKELYLAGTAIRELPSSIEKLTKLVTLDLENCKQLHQLPQGIGNLKAMVTLKLSGCSNLKSLPNLHAIFLRGSQCFNTNITMEMPKPLVQHPSIQESRLLFRSEIPDLCLINASRQESLAAFVYRQQNWPWSAIILQPSSIFHFLASKLFALVSLFLSNTCLVDIPKEICGLPSVNLLDLGGNSFSKIPESIKLFPKIRSLRLRHCKNLKSLPELPQSLELLNVHGCVSLKSVPWSFNRHLKQCTLSNCFGLSPEVFESFLSKALGLVKNMNRAQHQKLITVSSFSICVPASKGLKSSPDVFASEGLKFFVQKGSSVVIKLTSSQKNSFLGFIMLVVVSFHDNYDNGAGFSIMCTCIQKMKNGFSHRLQRTVQFWAPKEASKIQKDHIFCFYDAIIPFDAREGKVKFEFCPVDSQNEVLDSCEVNKCGVYVITDASGETSLTKKRTSPFKRERSGKKPFASSMDPGGFSSGQEPLLRSKRGRYRRSVESAILKIRKRKREEFL